MSSSIYGRLALTNLRNNRKTYLPYLLTGALTVMMYYIMGPSAAAKVSRRTVL